MENSRNNIDVLLNACTVIYTPVSATETGCRAVFRAAAHHRFLTQTSAEERKAMDYNSNDWNDFFDATQCPTRDAARNAGFKVASAMLG